MLWSSLDSGHDICIDNGLKPSTENTYFTCKIQLPCDLLHVFKISHIFSIFSFSVKCGEYYLLWFRVAVSALKMRPKKMQNIIKPIIFIELS